MERSIKRELCSGQTAYEQENQAKTLKCKIQTADRAEKSGNENVWLRKLDSEPKTVEEEQRFVSFGLCEISDQEKVIKCLKLQTKTSVSFDMIKQLFFLTNLPSFSKSRCFFVQICIINSTGPCLKSMGQIRFS